MHGLMQLGTEPHVADTHHPPYPQRPSICVLATYWTSLCPQKDHCLFLAEVSLCRSGPPPPLNPSGKLPQDQSNVEVAIDPFLTPDLVSCLSPCSHQSQFQALVSITCGAALCQIQEHTGDRMGPAVSLTPGWPSLGTAWPSSVFSALSVAACMLPPPNPPPNPAQPRLTSYR